MPSCINILILALLALLLPGCDCLTPKDENYTLENFLQLCYDKTRQGETGTCLNFPGMDDRGYCEKEWLKSRKKGTRVSLSPRSCALVMNVDLRKYCPTLSEHKPNLQGGNRWADYCATINTIPLHLCHGMVGQTANYCQIDDFIYATGYVTLTQDTKRNNASLSCKFQKCWEKMF